VGDEVAIQNRAYRAIELVASAVALAVDLGSACKISVVERACRLRESLAAFFGTSYRYLIV
jgi:hypothetical protein